MGQFRELTETVSSVGVCWLSFGFAEAVQAARRQQEKKEELLLESTVGPGIMVGSLQVQWSPGKQKRQKRGKRSRQVLEWCSWPPSLSEPKEDEEKARKEQQRELAKQKAQEQAASLFSERPCAVTDAQFLFSRHGRFR